MWVPIVLLTISFAAFMVFVLLYFLKTPDPKSTAGCEPGDCPDVVLPSPRTEEILDYTYNAAPDMNLQLELLPVDETKPNGVQMMRAYHTAYTPLLMKPIRPTNGIQSFNAAYLDKTRFLKLRPIKMRVRGILLRFVYDETYTAGTFTANPNMFIGIENISMDAVSPKFSTGILEPTTFGEIGFSTTDPDQPCEAREFDLTFDLEYSEEVIAKVEALSVVHIEFHVGITDMDRFTTLSGESSFFMYPFNILVDVDYRDVV